MNNEQVILTFVKDDAGKIVGVNVKVPLLERKHKGFYFVQCPLFRTLGYSDKSFEEAYKDHDKDLQIFLEIHIQQNTLNKALRSLNWTKKNDHYQSPELPHYWIDRVERRDFSYQVA